MARLMIEALEARELPSALPVDFVPQKPVEQKVLVASTSTSSTSSNNLKQMGLTIHNTYDVQQNGIIAILIGLKQPPQPTTEQPFILPFIEQEN